MKRELWVIAKNVSNTMGILNSARCSDDEEEPLSLEEQSLIVEAVNSETSGFMLDSMFDLINSASIRPTGRFCIRDDCDYYERKDVNKLTVADQTGKCLECIHNEKSKTANMDHFEG